MKNAFRYILKSKYTKLASVALVAAAAVIIPYKILNAEGPRDCDANSVMTCGAYEKSEFTGKAGSQNLWGVYADFGISEVDFNSASTVTGSVTKSGQIIANGQTLGNNAWSLGRHHMANSTARPIGGTTFWFRPTTVSFGSGQLEAFVNVEKGWAIIKSCGNPVISQAKPFGIIKKHVINVTEDPNKSHAADTVQDAIQVEQTDTLKYRVAITNDGFSPMTNTVMNDALPNGVELVSNPAQRQIEVPFGTVATGQTKFTDFTVKARKVPAKSCAINKAAFKADKDQKGEDTAVVCVEKEVPPQPPTPPEPPKPPKDVGCIDVKKVAFDNKNKSVSPVPKFTFKLNGQMTTTSNSQGKARFDDVKPGHHQVTEQALQGWQLISVTPSQGKVKVKAGDDCAVVVFKNRQKIPVTPQFVCKDLDAEPTKGVAPLTVRFTAEAGVSGGVTVEKYLFDFGDGQTAASDNASVEHTYQQTGQFVASVRIQTSHGTTAATNKCKVPIKANQKVQPQFVCKDLNAKPASGQPPLTVKFTARGQVSEGVSIEGYIFDFGDGSSQVFSTSNMVTHTYGKEDTYHASVVIRTSEGLTPPSEACKAVVKVSKQPVPPQPPQPPEVPVTPGAEAGAGQPLPITGPEAAAAGLLGSGGLAAAIRGYVRSRRSLLGALLDV